MYTCVNENISNGSQSINIIRYVIPRGWFALRPKIVDISKNWCLALVDETIVVSVHEK